MLKHSSVSVPVGSLGPGMHKVCLSPLSISDGYGVDSKCYFTLPTVLLGLLLCPWVWGISSQTLQCHATKSPELRTCRTLSLSQSVQSLVVSDSLRPHESQHARPPCPSPTPGVSQTHAHSVGDALQPSHPMSSPSPPALNPSQHHGLFQRVNSSHEVAKVLEFQFQHQSFQ